MSWIAPAVPVASPGVDPTLVVDWGSRPWLSLALVGSVAIGIGLAGLVRSDRVRLPRRGRESADDPDGRLPRAEIEEIEEAWIEELPDAETLDQPPVPPNASPETHRPPLDVVRESNGHAPRGGAGSESDDGSEA